MIIIVIAFFKAILSRDSKHRSSFLPIDRSIMYSLDEDEAMAIAIRASTLEHMQNEEQRSSMPTYLQVHEVEGNGWCFYECVRRHLQEGGGDYEDNRGITMKAVRSLVFVQTHSKSHITSCFRICDLFEL